MKKHYGSNATFLPLRYDKGSEEPLACTLIDLAVGSWNNPTFDIAYFLYLSTTPALRRTHEQEFLAFYHDHLISNLHKLGYDPSVYPYRYRLL